MAKTSPYPHVVPETAVEQAATTFAHPWNPASEITGTELVYLMGGENRANAVADFPLLDRRMVELDDEVAIDRLSDDKDFDAVAD